MIRRSKRARQPERPEDTIQYSEVAQQIKERLTVEEVVKFYGFEPDWHGYISCPFHNDHTPSLKVFAGDRPGWYCFGCGTGGSVIDFVMRLYGLSFRQACVRLSSDFGLNLTDSDTKSSRTDRKALAEARQRAAAREAAIAAEYRAAANEHCYWWQVQKYFAPSELDAESGYVHPLYAEAVKRLPVLEYWLDQHFGR